MQPSELARKASEMIQPGSDLVEGHLEVLEEMVRIDSRSFNVNEFEGDRTTPSDMQEILKCAEAYLRQIGFTYTRINRAPAGQVLSAPILLAEIPAAKEKPTFLFYAHLDKQPYMDDSRWEKWGGVPPTQLRWNEDRTRAYGRGAADDLSGVISIGIAVDALLKSIGFNPQNPSPENRSNLPCNIKIIFETEEECGSPSLAEQIHQNEKFFRNTDCVLITDVVNPNQGVPGLTTSLRGILQTEVSVTSNETPTGIDPQTALYKVLATLIREDHSLAVKGIREADQRENEEEKKGYAQVPTSIDQLRETAGILPETALTVPARKEELLVAQLRKSFANVRPGHRIAGSIIFGRAGSRLTFPSCTDPESLHRQLKITLNQFNTFNLQLNLNKIPGSGESAAFDLVVQSAEKDPHSGINGGPFPVAELQLAVLIDRLIADNGDLHQDISTLITSPPSELRVQTQSLHVEPNGQTRLFENPSAKAIVEIRLAPGNDEETAAGYLISHLKENLLPGFELKLIPDKSAPPWMTKITHPAFPIILESLERGYGRKSCLYGCGGSIPFVPKLMDALGNVQPMCLGAYDPDARMHEPGESLSMPDLLGCSRSMIHFITRASEAYPRNQNR